MTDQPCLEVPFDEVEKWEKIEGSCARLYAAAEWGYKKGLATPPPEPLSPTIERLLQMPGSSWVKYSPWEREGYCDEQGRCWFQQYGKWILAHPESIVNSVCCLPAYVNPKVTQ